MHATTAVGVIGQADLAFTRLKPGRMPGVLNSFP
jgi:hypothetical protein